jgi:hypothetical protein
LISHFILKSFTIKKRQQTNKKGGETRAYAQSLHETFFASGVAITLRQSVGG